MAHQGAPPTGGKGQRGRGAEEQKNPRAQAEPQGLATRPGGRRRPLVTDL